MMKKTVLIAMMLASTGTVQGQTELVMSRLAITRELSPVSIVEMLEKQLGDQFRQKALQSAQPSTARLIAGREVLTRGTVVRGSETRFCYLVFPADAIRFSGSEICLEDGTILKPVPGTPVQLLSREDNLAIVRIPNVEHAVSVKSSDVRSTVGSFVGYLNDGVWKTGSITNGPRSALNDIDPQVRGALAKHWERIGLRVSKRRCGFPEVLETDLNLLPEEAGAPVFDRNGIFHGVAISRADQHSTLVIPALRLSQLITKFERAHRG